MQRLTVVLVAAVVAAPASAPAQPVEPEAPGIVRPAAPAIDEAKIRELVDREVARILTERAAKEAAERAAKEAEKEATVNDDAGEIKGASGFMDTRLAFTLTNENVLVQPGETSPSVPGWRFGTPGPLGVLFFDNYDTRYSGFETLSHAVMYRDYSHGHLQAEGAIVLRLNELTENLINVSDDGSYLTLANWKDPSHKDPTRISLTVFPVSADRFRLGYSYRLSWGGNPEYQRSNASAPGLKLQYDGPAGYVFVGAKSSLIVDPAIGEQRAALAVLGGAGFDPSPSVRLEVNGGYFDRGDSVLPEVREKVQLFGASMQASIHRGMPVRSSLDYRLYKFNGESISGLFAPESYPGGLAWLAQSELTVLGQTLKDPEGPGTTVQTGVAGDLNVRVKYERLRLRLDLSYRDLAFILHSRPGLPPYEGFPAAYSTSPDYFGAVGLDHNWSDWLTLGLIAGLERPASLTSPMGIPGTAAERLGMATAVIRNNNVDTLTTILPPGRRVAAQLALKTTARLDFARIFSALVEVFYSYDRNQSRERRSCDNPAGCPVEFESAPFHQLGLNATLQARF